MRTRFAVSCVALLVMATQLHAQSGSTTRGPARFGVLGGMNAATLNGGDGDAPDRRTGLLVGAYVVKPLNAHLSLRPELLYSQKGAEVSSSGELFTFTSAIELAYIDVPMLLQYEGGTPSGITPHVFVGPTFGFKAGCTLTETSDNTGGVEQSSDCEDQGGELEAFDLGGLVGAGVGFPLGSVRGTVGVRFQQGFTEIAMDSEIKNRVISVYGSVEFGRR